MQISEIKGKIEEIISEYSPLIRPISDQRSTKDYRYKVALNLLRNFLEKIGENR